MRKREWLRCTDAERMVKEVWHLGDLGFIKPRPFFLFVLTAGERLFRDDGGDILRPTVELAWRRAEGRATDEEVAHHGERMQAIYEAANLANNWQLARLLNVLAILFHEPGSAARTLTFPHPMEDPGSSRAPLLSPAELTKCCDLFREFFSPLNGNHPFDPSWRTTAVVALATGINEDSAFERLPVLADALEDAGCCDRDIFTHLRGKGPHVRGCWPVDLILGRS
jgi:hypothetical protein